MTGDISRPTTGAVSVSHQTGSTRRNLMPMRKICLSPALGDAQIIIREIADETWMCQHEIHWWRLEKNSGITQSIAPFKPGTLFPAHLPDVFDSPEAVIPYAYFRPTFAVLARKRT